MTIVNIYEAKTNFSKLINASIRGEEVIVAKGGIPVAKIVPYNAQLPDRKGGQIKDIMTISDSFDEPLPEDCLNEFYIKDF